MKRVVMTVSDDDMILEMDAHGLTGSLDGLCQILVSP